MTLFPEHIKVIVCAGMGGVGKTTLSAAIGILAAQQGKRVLIFTIDPAQRLADAMGLTQNLNQETLLTLPFKTEGQVSALMIHPSSVFDRFIYNSGLSDPQIDRILHNNLYKQLSTQLSGSQEFTSLERLVTCLESEKYDLILLDTPPAQHAVDFLYAPQKISTLFQNSITQWFLDKPRFSGGFLKSLLNRGTKTALATLEKITGSSFMEELTDFFEAIAEIQMQVSEKSRKAHQLLVSTQCTFVLITGFDRYHHQGIINFADELHKGGYSLSSIIVNRCYPHWIPSPQLHEREHFIPLLDFHQRFLPFYQERDRELAQLQSQFQKKVPLIRIPEWEINLSGLEGLGVLAQKMEPQLTHFLE